MKDWYKSWFNSPFYLTVYNHRDTHDAEKLLDLILRYINPNSELKVLDTACGAGRHAIYLAEKGFDVYGFDLSKTLLLEAIKKAELGNINVKFLLTDIRAACFKIKFDIILNLFTSFGYFENDNENFRFFIKAKSFLAKEGVLIIDYFNPKYLKKNLIDYSEKNINSIIIKEKRYFQGERVNKSIEIISEKNTYHFEESVALYNYDYLKRKFEEMGYKIVKQWGNYDGDSFNEEVSERIILVLKQCDI
ncbi:class I SAM-dependent methyltransferase [Melioribacteraceae bacterium 4301-Me]|uniref:class I SAM-dependent methyltransferase n=1 Tax=Pyranulibacter aquaticus TaxID=3163344 RepID=UPI003597A9AB